MSRDDRESVSPTSPTRATRGWGQQITRRIDVGTGNRLLSTSNESFQYDARHHLAERTRYLGAAREPDTTRYTYDSFDMLVRIERQRPELPPWLLRLEPNDAADTEELNAASQLQT